MQPRSKPVTTLRTYKGGVLAVTKHGFPVKNTWQEAVFQKPKLITAVHLLPKGGEEERVRLANAAECDYIERYREVQEDVAARQKLLQEAANLENKYREIFAQDRENDSLNDPYVTLIPVNRYGELFRCVPPSDAPRVFPLGDQQKKLGERAIVSPEVFRKNFDVFTEGLLQYVNWDNVFMAGGAVLACLQPLPKKYTGTNQQSREYYHDVAYKNSDIDLFIYGLDEEEAKQKLMEIFYAVCEKTMPLIQTIAFRSTNAITIVSQYPYRHVQIISRLYKSPAEILMGFDVDSCSAGYDGTTVWMTPRCHHALVVQANTIDMSRRSPSYETRLAKYATRGFAVEVPTLRRELVDPQIFERRFDLVNGLAKLLLFERLSTPEARAKFKEEQRRKQLRPTQEKHGKYTTVILKEFAGDSYLVERLEEQPAPASDYSTVFLPWGPKWDAKKIRKLMYTKDVLLNMDFSQPSGIQRHRHPCFFGTMQEVLQDCCGQCPELRDVQPSDASEYVEGKLKFMTVNPGQQAIGSFHPITEGDWMEGAFVNEHTETLMMAVASLDIERLKSALADPAVQVNAKDVSGRTALIVAAFTGNVEGARELIAHGARLCEKTNDGRTALHIAAAYGHAEIIELMIERARVVNAELEKELREERAAEVARRLADIAAEGSGPRDKDFWRRRYLRKIAREKEEAQRKAESEDRRSLDRLDIDQKDTDWLMTPLSYAVYFGKEECARVLIKHGANIDQQLTYSTDKTPTVSYSLLQLALFGNYGAIVKLLLTEGANINSLDVSGQTVLHSAAVLLRSTIVQELLAWKTMRSDHRLPSPFPGQSEDWQLAMSSPSFHTSNTTPEEFANSLRQKMQQSPAIVPNQLQPDAINCEAKTALGLLIQGWAQYRELGQLAEAELTMKALLQGGASIQHAAGETAEQPIHLAAACREPTVLRLLLQHGADVNAVKKSTVGWNSTRGDTPLDLVLTDLEQCQAVPSAPYQAKASKQEFLDFLLNKAEQGSYESYALTKLKETATLEQTKKHPWEIDQEDEEDKDPEKQKERVGRLMECRDLLHFAKGRRFEHLSFPENDPRGYRAIQQQMRQSASSENGPVAFKIGVTSGDRNDCPPPIALNEVFEPLSRKSCRVSFGSRMQMRYRDLFDAVVKGDVDLVQQLTKPTVHVEEQLIVAVRSQLLGMTPLQIAVDRNFPEMVRTLVKIAAQQYASSNPTTEDSSTTTGALRRIDNTQLAAISESSSSIAEVLQKMQPSAAQSSTDDDMAGSNVVCGTSAAEFVKSTGSRWGTLTAVGVAIQQGNVAALQALLDVCDELQLMTGPLDATRLSAHLLQAQCLEIPEGNLKVTPFEAAMHYDQVEMAKFLLRHGVAECFGIDMDAITKAGEGGYLRAASEEGQTPQTDTHRCIHLSSDFRLHHPMRALHIAASAGSHRCIEFLLGNDSAGYIVVTEEEEMEGGEDVQQEPLFSLSQQNEEGLTALHEAVKCRKVETLRCLLAAGAVASDNEAVQTAVNICQTIADEGKRKPVIPVLSLAVNTMQLDAMEALLQANADTSLLCPEKEAALHKAAALCFYEGIQLLLKYKADVQARNKRGWTPIHTVVNTSRKEQKSSQKASHPVTRPATECLQLLLTSDTTAVDSKSDKGETALMIAAQCGTPSLLQMLLDSKADPTLLDASGKTALHHASRGVSEPCISLLLKGPTPTNTEDFEARTPNDWCVAALERALQSTSEKLVETSTQYAAYPALDTANKGVPRRLVPAAAFRDYTLMVAQASGAAHGSASGSDEGSVASGAEEMESEDNGGSNEGSNEGSDGGDADMGEEAEEEAAESEDDGNAKKRKRDEEEEDQENAEEGETGEERGQHHG